MKNVIVFFYAFLCFSTLSFSQDIYFLNPEDGETITGNFSETQVAVNFSKNWSLTPYPPRVSIAHDIKLITHNGTYVDDAIPQWFYLASGTYTWTLELWELFLDDQEMVKTAEETITFNVKFNVKIQNNFGSGTIRVNGNPVSSGSSYNKFVGDNLALGAIDQYSSGYDYIWNTSGTNNSNWSKRTKTQGAFHNIPGATSKNHNYTVASNDNYATVQAEMKKVCNVTFRNYLNGQGLGYVGTIKVNGVEYSPPASGFEVVEQNQISAQAIPQSFYQGIDHVFDHWSTGSTQSGTSFNPTSHITYTAYFKGIPNNLYRNLTINWSDPRWTPVQLTWNEHPNPYVTSYQIWRKVKQNGFYGSPELLATIPRSGPNTYTDYEYSITPTYSDALLQYDVRPYYSMDQTYANPSWVAAYGEMFLKDSAKVSQGRLIKDYAIGNYPNPFNPTTKINYQLPQKGFVTIKAYDAIGKEVATLVNEYKESGIYEVDFGGNNLPSGMYIYSMNVNGYTESKKMLLLK